MVLKEITQKEFFSCAIKSDDFSIYQLPEWGELKKENGWKPIFLGLFDEKKVLASTMLLEKRLPLKLKMYYSPRGFLFDLENKELLKTFTEELIKYVKKHKGFMVKVDPNYIYAIYDKNGENQNIVHPKAIDNFKELKYKHLGFTKYFETLQPRYLCRINIQDTFDSTLATFSKSTRKNIEKTQKMGVEVCEVSSKDIDRFLKVMRQSCDENKTILRPDSYYKNMYELMNKYIKLYVTYIDTKKYYTYIQNEIKEKKDKLSALKIQMSKTNVGNKQNNELKVLESQINKLQTNLSEANKLKESSSIIDIGALMSIFMKDEGITFMSGTLHKYKDFYPKYAYYAKHINECVKEKKKYCNFYGISGDLNPDNKLYSIYEIKKGFNPDIIELIGEFDLITNRFKFFEYRALLSFYNISKKILHPNRKGE